VVQEYSTAFAYIGVASYGALGHVPPRLPFIFFLSLQNRANFELGLYVVAYPEKEYTGL